MFGGNGGFGGGGGGGYGNNPFAGGIGELPMKKKIIKICVQTRFIFSWHVFARN